MSGIANVSARRLHNLNFVEGRRTPERTGESRKARNGVIANDDFGNFEKLKEVEMLVLSRKLNEKIVIDGGIVITIVKIDRNQIRIGIEAPANVAVFREEIAPASLQTSRNRDAVTITV